MVTVKQFLVACGLKISPERIRLVRHSGHFGRSIRQIISDGAFAHYQADQCGSIRPFDNCQVILSFIAIEGSRAEFYGAYRVLKSRSPTPEDFSDAPSYLTTVDHGGKIRIWYELEELPEFLPLRGRLVTRWTAPRGWYQTKDLPVEQLLPIGNLVQFPGYQDVVLTWKELQEIVSTPRLHRDWKTALSETAGIYRIVDHSSGKIYIGAAYGSEGIWGRWSNYAKTGHGGNKLLVDRDPAFFQWSIVRTLSGSMAPMEIVRVERIEMRKHGSRAIGLNWPEST